jgi:Fuc2NAc and GlcNAc transferase
MTTTLCTMASIAWTATIPDPALIGGAFVATLVGTLVFRRVLVRAAMLDHPNERSSHDVPVPRGGGVVFVAACALALLLLITRGALHPVMWATFAGLLAIALIGFIDDRRHVGAASRLAFHLSGSAAAVFAATFGSAAWLPAEITAHPIVPVAGVLLLAVASAWMVNLVNFVDGIDGLAALGGATILAAAALLPAVLPVESALPGGETPALRADSEALRAFALACAAAVGAFGVVNISRWRIFMGDAGSGALGLLIAFTLVALAMGRGLAPLAALALPAVFVADTTTTLAIRVWRREHPARAHRTHAYQRLVRRGWPHLAVSGTYLAVFATTALPVAIYAQSGGAYASAAVAGLYVTLAIAAILLGAGREPRTTQINAPVTA